MPTITAVPTRPRPIVRVIAGARRDITHSATRLASRLASQLRRSARSYRAVSRSCWSLKNRCGSTSGNEMPAGIRVRQSSHAHTSQSAAAATIVARWMRRLAVISDVHANDVALETVLHDVDAAGVDAVWCLGDVVGYGPQPTRCCTIVRERAAVCLVGNHDLAVLGKVETTDFNLEAALATEWTRSVLDGDARAFLDALEPAA